MGNLDEAAALGVMHMRVANMEVPDCEMAEVIFELSGAMEIMDQTDVESFTKCHADVWGTSARRRRPSRTGTGGSGSLCLMPLQRVHGVPTGEAEVAAKTKQGRRRIRRSPTTRSHIARRSRCSHPGASIWRGAAKGMWWVHLPPLPRRREPWMPQGMGQACRGALRYAGYQPASRHGLCDSDRTTRGLCLTDSGRIEHAG